MKNVGYYESSSDDDEKEKVLTEKEKRFKALREIITKIEDKCKI